MIRAFQVSQGATGAWRAGMRACVFSALLLMGVFGIIPAERADAASVTAVQKSGKPQSLVTTSPAAASVASAQGSPLSTTKKTVPGVGNGTQTAPGLANNPSPYRGGNPVSPSRPSTAGGYH
jgi:hypothetical protein